MGGDTGSLALLLLMCLPGFQAARILFLYMPTYSHIRGSLNVATELASRGHVVWNALSTKLANHKGMQATGVNILKYDAVEDLNLDNFVDSIVADCLKETCTLHLDVMKKVCDQILRDKELFKRITDLNFDLIILDVVPVARMLTVIAHRLDIPFIFMGAAFEPQVSRTPFIPSASPFIIFPRTPKMDFGTRVANVITTLMYVFVYDPFCSLRPVATYAPEKPYISMESLTAKAWLWLIDIEPLLHYPVATLPNVKLIGSLSATEPKSPPDEYKKFMDESKEGVVIVSFGSNVKSLPDVISKRLLEAFSRTNYRFIFKTDKKVKVTRNVILTDWMPQSDLFAHPNTKLFITHCGASSQNEAFLKGVPMIGFPIFGDQPYNSVKLVYHGFGVNMDLRTFTVDDLVSNINEVIQNSSYSQKIKKAAEITKLRKRSPKDEAVYWIEHVLKYGGAHLRSYCQDMPLYQYLCLDVIGLVLFILHVCIFLIWKSCCYCCRKASNQSKQKLE
ncbi:UDP-glucuronosyltransferase 1-2-like [Haliotis rufescens]|uniref:UDP-glucuronosyltransferase 1-2-like n=1 Tax=Haliotis rufescens TaxID=6454 RepID=UPI00201F9311|nr:UDP-glucuronosyltransferase 1-2-like [Haliotis rufescens]